MTREVMDPPTPHRHDRRMSITTVHPHTAATDDERRLRRVLLANAGTSSLGGLTALLAAGPVDELLGADSIGWVRIVGVGLVAFAAVVVFVARSSRRTLQAEAPVISVGDLAWVVGTVVAIGAGWFSTAGATAMAGVAALVGGFGLAQWTLARRMRQTTASPTGVS